MDPRRELGLINKTVRRRNREVGESVMWYEFKPISSGSDYDDVYNEGVPGIGGRNYAKGVVVPTIFIEEMEDAFRAMEEGRQPTQNVHAVILFKDMAAAGVSNPREYKGHLNDVFEYDQRFYKIQDYRVRGRLTKSSPSGEAVIAVTGFEVYVDQEFPFSTGLRNPNYPSLPWPTSFPS